MSPGDFSSGSQATSDEQQLPRPTTKRRQRKSRARGLRVKTGCSTCRKRHLKCDEGTPICKNCARANRACGYGTPSDSNDNVKSPAKERTSQLNATLPSLSHHIPPTSIASIVDLNSISGNTTIGTHRGLISPQRGEDRVTGHSSQFFPIGPPVRDPGQNSQESTSVYSPGSTEPSITPREFTSSGRFLTADSASIRWLELLATDAAQADGSFTLDTGHRYSDQFSLHAQREHPPVSTPHSGFVSPHHASGSVSPVDVRSYSHQNHIPYPPSDLLFWQASVPIQLRLGEYKIFRNFVDRLSLWIDLFDPLRNFSTYVPRLALRNVGVMKSILALSARHISLNNSKICDRNIAIQYYYETLHYLQTALQSESYTRSDELVATALLVSTYEMLDESGIGWQRHLKGVFWIQRSQEINGESGGLKQAVWWAWLRQDVWAAFRERRRAHSFFQPRKPYSILEPVEMASRSVYLLAQAVNYCSDTEKAIDEKNPPRRMDKADRLLSMLEEWRGCLGAEFNPLPTAKGEEDEFEPIWLHPPHFGVALQIYSFARILVILHRPSISGSNDFLEDTNLKESLVDSVNTICGIAMTQEDEACNLISSQCLYGAGLCIKNKRQRQIVLDLIDKCEKTTGWSSCYWKVDLQRDLE